MEVVGLSFKVVVGVAEAALFAPGAFGLEVVGEGVEAGLAGSPGRGAEAVAAGLEGANVLGHVGEELVAVPELQVDADLRQKGLAGGELALGVGGGGRGGAEVQTLVEADEVAGGEGLAGLEAGGEGEGVRELELILEVDLEEVGGKVIGPLGVEGVLGCVVDGEGRSLERGAVEAPGEIEAFLLEPDAALEGVAVGLVGERAEEAAAGDAVLRGALGDRRDGGEAGGIDGGDVRGVPEASAGVVVAVEGGLRGEVAGDGGVVLDVAEEVFAQAAGGVVADVFGVVREIAEALGLDGGDGAGKGG